MKSSHLYIVPLDIIIPIAARDLHLVNIYMPYIVWMGINLNLYRAAIGLHYVREYAPLQRIKHILIMSQFLITFLTGMISDLALQFKCAFATLFLYILQAMTGIVVALLYLRLLLQLSNDIETQTGPRDSDDHVLSIFHLNIRSLRNKIPYLCDIAGEYTHRQKLSNSKLVLNIKKMFHTKLLEFKFYYLHLTSFEYTISVTEQMYNVKSVKAGIYWRGVCFFNVWVWHFVKGSISNRFLRSCELSEGNRFIFMENPIEDMCQGKDIFS